MLIPVNGGGYSLEPMGIYRGFNMRMGASFRNKADNAAARFLSLSEGSPLERTPSKRDTSLRNAPLIMAVQALR
jgi:hypothetical protein